MRNKNINIRLTDKEFNMIEKKAIKAHLTKTEFVVRSCMNEPITVVEGLQDVAKQIHYLSNNLNQLVILAHQGKLNNIDLEPCRKELDRIWQYACSLTKNAPHHTV